MREVELKRHSDKRDVRAQRILDAAAELILRWGYDKTTVDDIARQAGVAKGTLYLHWRAREALFLALLQRERLQLVETVISRMETTEATLTDLLRASAEAILSRPLLMAALQGDRNVLGKLTHTLEAQQLQAARIEGFTTYLSELREAGQVRTDVTQETQLYQLSAIFLGFLMLAPLFPKGLRPSEVVQADLLADAVARTLGSVTEGKEATESLWRYLKGERALAQADLLGLETVGE